MHIVPLTVSVIILVSELKGLEALQSSGHLWDFPLESVRMRHRMLALEADRPGFQSRLCHLCESRYLTYLAFPICKMGRSSCENE